MDFILVYQVGDKAAQVIPFALQAILAEEGKHPLRENIAGSSNQA
jgi:hypothetical protein